MEAIKLDNIKPLTDFRKNMKAYITKLNSTKQPIILTQHGKSAAVVMDAETYQEMRDQLEFMRKVALGLEDYKQGRVYSLDETFDDLENIIASSEGR